MSTEYLHHYADIVATYEFPECDGAHENVKRDRKGEAIRSEERPYIVCPQCPVAEIVKRPGCLHYNEARPTVADPIIELAQELEAIGLMTTRLQRMLQRYKNDEDRKPDLDSDFVHAYRGENPLHDKIPNRAEAQTAALPTALKHRAMISRTRELCEGLLARVPPRSKKEEHPPST